MPSTLISPNRVDHGAGGDPDQREGVVAVAGDADADLVGRDAVGVVELGSVVGQDGGCTAAAPGVDRDDGGGRGAVVEAVDGVVAEGTSASPAL
ncbi:MAG: hypothetical protein R3F59_07705 [Myxococcota bacterium]